VISLQILLAALLGWLEREQRDVIAFLREENRTHWPALVAADFFTTEVWTVRGLVTYYTIFAIELRGEFTSSAQRVIPTKRSLSKPCVI
jgi:hypothetical protein